MSTGQRQRLRLLVTGSSGRIGQVLVAHWADHCQVVGYDRQDPSAPVPGVEYHRGDLLERDKLAKALAGVDAVVHLAGIPYDIPPLHQVFQTNVQGTFNCLDLAVEQGAEVVLFASSIMAYGFGQNAAPLYLPVDEAHPLLADRPYGLSKNVGEQLCHSFTQRCGIRTFCFRLTAAVASSDQYQAYPYDGAELAVAIHAYFDVRDFAALALAAIEAKSLQHEVFLVSAADSGHRRPSAELVEAYYSHTQLTEGLGAYAPLVSTAKAERLLGYKPRYSWRCPDGAPTEES